jgi:hypothetical protein
MHTVVATGRWSWLMAGSATCVTANAAQDECGSTCCSSVQPWISAGVAWTIYAWYPFHCVLLQARGGIPGNSATAESVESSGSTMARKWVQALTLPKASPCFWGCSDHGRSEAVYSIIRTRCAVCDQILKLAGYGLLAVVPPQPYVTALQRRSIEYISE